MPNKRFNFVEKLFFSHFAILFSAELISKYVYSAISSITSNHSSRNYGAIYTSGVSNDAGIWLAEICYTDTPTFKTKVHNMCFIWNEDKVGLNSIYWKKLHTTNIGFDNKIINLMLSHLLVKYLNEHTNEGQSWVGIIRNGYTLKY